MKLSAETKRALKQALALHVLVLVVMLTQIQWPGRSVQPTVSYAMQDIDIVQAQAISAQALDDELARLAEKARAEEAERQRQIELAREAERKQAEEAAKAAELARVEREREAQAQRLAEEAAEAARLQAEAEAALLAQMHEEQLLAEQAALEAAQQAELDALLMGEVERYTLMVKQKVMQNWLVQRGYEGYTTLLHVRVAPSGNVLDVQVLEESGQEAMDRSAISAVYRSSPLPVPEDPAVFESFREIRLTLRPEYG